MVCATQNRKEEKRGSHDVSTLILSLVKYHWTLDGHHEGRGTSLFGIVDEVSLLLELINLCNRFLLTSQATGGRTTRMNQNLDEDMDHINGESRTDDSKNILHSAVHTKH